MRKKVVDKKDEEETGRIIRQARLRKRQLTVIESYKNRNKNLDIRKKCDQCDFCTHDLMTIREHMKQHEREKKNKEERKMSKMMSSEIRQTSVNMKHNEEETILKKIQEIRKQAEMNSESSNNEKEKFSSKDITKPPPSNTSSNKINTAVTAASASKTTDSKFSKTILNSPSTSPSTSTSQKQDRQNHFATFAHLPVVNKNICSSPYKNKKKCEVNMTLSKEN